MLMKHIDCYHYLRELLTAILKVAVIALMLTAPRPVSAQTAKSFTETTILYHSESGDKQLPAYEMIEMIEGNLENIASYAFLFTWAQMDLAIINKQLYFLQLDMVYLTGINLFSELKDVNVDFGLKLDTDDLVIGRLNGTRVKFEKFSDGIFHGLRTLATFKTTDLELLCAHNVMSIILHPEGSDMYYSFKLDSKIKTASIFSSMINDLKKKNEHSTPQSVPMRDLSQPIVDSPDEGPTFPGGSLALMQYIAQHLQYPETAQRNGEQGRVIVQLVIEIDGSVGEVKVLRGVSAELDREAVRVTRSLPRWTPGKVGGNPVRVNYTLPVVFRLQ